MIPLVFVLLGVEVEPVGTKDGKIGDVPCPGTSEPGSPESERVGGSADEDEADLGWPSAGTGTDASGDPVGDPD